MSELPPQHASGYQPGQGEGITSLEIEVLPSWGYQKVAIRGTYQFPEPRALTEINQPLADLYTALEQQAADRVDALVALKDDKEGAAKSARRQALTVPAGGGNQPPRPPHIATAGEPEPDPEGEGHPRFGGGPVWEVGRKPKGKGSFKYRPTSDVSEQDFVQAAKDTLQSAGVDPDDVFVFDDRTGNYGLESGKESYSAGKAKAKDDTALKMALPEGRDIVAYIDFNENTGAVEANLSKDGKAAAQAIAIASKLGGQQIA